MENSNVKITNRKPFLAYSQLQDKNISVKKAKGIVCNQYNKLNNWLGIESVSDQVWYYGTFVLSIAMIVLTLLISGLLYGF
ncbi:hypothetical protein COO16_04290 [Bacillus pseudomycoides]|uniref:hypothetical protein n=1 Tax=Bacillus pseudomycoides TaxID=64104 RepID=UPI000BEE470D|nr:hypothetical protein [Bacillus pseudomycoides]PDY14187.1 hypothetical protein COO16_04290 [Bacillus pseudomycoides]